MLYRSLALSLLVFCSVTLGASPSRSSPLTFGPLDGGRAAVQGVRIRALARASDGVLYAGGFGVAGDDAQPHPKNAPLGSVFLISRDHGTTWSMRSNPAPRGGQPVSRVWLDHTRWPPMFQVNQIAISPHDPKTIYAAGVNIAGFSHYLLRSRDGGRTWQDVLIWRRVIGPGGDWALTTNIVVTPATRHFLTNQLVRFGAAVAIDPRNPRRLYLGTETLGVLGSTDGGASWLYNPSSPIVGTGVSEQLAIDPYRPGTVYALVQGTTFSQFYRTDDGGATWRTLWHGDYASGLLLEGRTLYLVRSQEIDASLDRGRHWRPAVNVRTLPGLTHPIAVGSNRMSGLIVQALHRKGVWYVSQINLTVADVTGLYVTTNNGATWRLLTNGVRGPRGSLAGPVSDGSQTVIWVDDMAGTAVLLTASQVDGLYRWSLAP